MTELENIQTEAADAVDADLILGLAAFCNEYVADGGDYMRMVSLLANVLGAALRNFEPEQQASALKSVYKIIDLQIGGAEGVGHG